MRLLNTTAATQPWRTGQTGNRKSESLAPGEHRDLDVDPKDKTLMARLHAGTAVEVDTDGKPVPNPATGKAASAPSAPQGGTRQRREKPGA